MEPRIRVLVVENRVTEQHGFRLLMVPSMRLQLLDIVDTPEKAIEFVAKHEVDVVMMDLNFDRFDMGEAAATAIQHIKSTQPNIRILAMTGFMELLPRAREAGADMGISKSDLFSTPTIEDRVNDVLHAVPLGVQRPRIDLSIDELGVLDDKANDLTDEQVAAKRDHGKRWVEERLISIRQKLNVHSTVGAVGRAYQLGLLPLPKTDDSRPIR